MVAASAAKKTNYYLEETEKDGEVRTFYFCDENGRKACPKKFAYCNSRCALFLRTGGEKRVQLCSGQTVYF